MTVREEETKLAVLIDSDNVSYTYVKPMMEEIARYGTPTIKRIYGDWTTPESAGWKNVLLENAIIPIQQYRYTSGKNSTDSTLIIDAMDILYSGSVSGFCIVSSDSDFTRLATRLREAGMLVLGIGEEKTPAPFIAACDRFIYLEIIAPKPEEKKKPEPHKARKTKVPKEIRQLVLNSVNDVADEDGWAFLGDVGNMILRKQPSFDSRNYGYSKLTNFIKSLGIFEIDKRDTSNRGIKHIYIRDRDFVQRETKDE
ncbi:MAG: NYN domain-containing protein [Acutalibacteraceae bacterium]